MFCQCFGSRYCLGRAMSVFLFHFSRCSPCRAWVQAGSEMGKEGEGKHRAVLTGVATHLSRTCCPFCRGPAGGRCGAAVRSAASPAGRTRSRCRSPRRRPTQRTCGTGRQSQDRQRHYTKHTCNTLTLQPHFCASSYARHPRDATVYPLLISDKKLLSVKVISQAQH